MSGNTALTKAKDAKKDEFYTRYEDIQAELNHYEEHFKGKTVFCNCDDPYESNFCKFFLKNFNYLGLKRLICTSFASSSIIGQQLSIFDEENEPLTSKNGYVMDISEVPMNNGRGVSDTDIHNLLTSKSRGVKRLKENGDFRSAECIEYLKQADIVVTNPPFSLFREYVAQLIEYDKKFLIIGNQNAITYKEIFPMIKNNKIWLGNGFVGGNAYFYTNEKRDYANGVYDSQAGTVKFRNCHWFTNLDLKKRHEKLILYKRYYGNEESYPKYDNYDAINVDKVADIPCDYFEDMGVPITYLDKHNPEDFEIIKFRKGDDERDLEYSLPMSSQIVNAERERERERETEDHALLQNTHQEKALEELWESPLHSSINTTPSNSKSSGLTDMCPTTQNTDTDSHLVERKPMQECLSSTRCNGIMGVPITFLDKYNPEQFEILGMSASVKYRHEIVGIDFLGDKDGRPLINGKNTYARIFIRRKYENSTNAYKG